jgi:hypothetical protein
MHEFGDKEYVTMFMKCDDGRYATNLTTAMTYNLTTLCPDVLRIRTSAYPAPQTQRAP